MPITWGQNYYYLYVQLKDYASGRRANEIMNPIAAAMSSVGSATRVNASVGPALRRSAVIFAPVPA